MQADIPIGEVLTTIGFDRRANSQPVRGGADALLWKIDTGNDQYALRLLRPDQHEQARTEIRLSQWINEQSTSIHVPEVLHAGVWNDRPAYLMRWIDGRTLGNTLLDPQFAMVLATAFGETQARIHAIPPPAELRPFAESWRSRIGGDAMLRALLEELTSETSLLHLDYHPLNVLAHHNQLVAVLDWANAETGDRRIDLARTDAILNLAPVPPETDPDVMEAFISGWTIGYERTAGEIDLPPVFRWWAGSLIELELTPRVGMASLPWLDEAHISRVRQWTSQFRP